MRIKKIMTAVLTVMLLVTGMIGNGITIQEVKASSIVNSEDGVNFVVKPGETTHIRLPMKVFDTSVFTPSSAIVDGNEKSPFTFSDQTLMTEYGVIAEAIPMNVNTYAEFDVKVKETAVIGSYPADLTITGTYNELTEYGFVLKPYTCTLRFKLNILEEKIPAQLTINSVFYGDGAIGTDTNLSFFIKNEGELTARNVFISLNYDGTGIDKKYTTRSIKIGDLTPGSEKAVSLPITILPTAITGVKTIPLNFTYKSIDGDALTDAYNIKINVVLNDNAPILVIDNVKNNENLVPGNDFMLGITLSNMGESKAENIAISISEEDANVGNGILKNYFTDAITVSNIKSGGTKEVEIPLTVVKNTTGGTKALKLNISYTDGAGIPNLLTTTVYMDVNGGDTPTTEKPNIIISSVKQSPAQPVAGEKLEVSFDIVNKGLVDITELKIYTEGLTGATFIPVNAEPYQYIELLKSGETKRITIPLIASDIIPEGLNNLTVKYTYNYTGNASDPESVIIPVRDVQNETGSSVIPKIIISKYTTDLEELKAGSTFKFTFDLYNTNSTTAAKNITVTVSKPAGQQEVFTVTQGSNSFFINKIDPGETVQNTLEFKIKSDTATGAYPITITIEYEYDGMKANTTTGKTGEIRTEELNLQVAENARPVVDNVNVYSFEGNIMLGNPATLAFEFYNMGKSQLNNVVATVEGDFLKSDGSMYFIGNVTPGLSTYAEFEVIPNIEGTAKGVLKVTYENSNGEQVEYKKEFEAMVMGATVFDPGMGDGGSGEVFNPGVPVAKKAILPVWLFILIQVLVFPLFIFITRKVIINVYKSKLRKKEEEKY